MSLTTPVVPLAHLFTGRNQQGQYIKGCTIPIGIRRKISNSLKKRIPWNKGENGLQVAWNKGKHTGQIPWNKGKPKDQQPMFGRHLSEQHRRKTSESMKRWYSQRTHSEETKKRKRLSESLKKYYAEHPVRLPAWNKGKQLSEELKRKLSEAHKGKHYPKISLAKRGRVAWNKGRKGKLGGNSGSFKKGIRASPSTEFKRKYYGKEREEWLASKEKIKGVEYRAFRKTVFKQQGYTCTICDQTKGLLEIHHKKSFASHPELFFQVSNGMVLCKICHDTWHTIFGKNGDWEYDGGFLNFPEEKILSFARDG